MADRNCVFCNIYDEKEPASIFYKDEEVVIFSDIRPAAEHHYLVVPKEHLVNAKNLTKEHIPLVEKLVMHGKRFLEEKHADVNDSRFGFHWPPFNSISHLHLHVISPASQMSFLSKIIFKEGSLWFVKAIDMVRYQQRMTGLSSSYVKLLCNDPVLNPQYVLQRLARL